MVKPRNNPKVKTKVFNIWSTRMLFQGLCFKRNQHAQIVLVKATKSRAVFKSCWCGWLAETCGTLLRILSKTKVSIFSIFPPATRLTHSFGGPCQLIQLLEVYDLETLKDFPLFIFCKNRHSHPLNYNIQESTIIINNIHPVNPV